MLDASAMKKSTENLIVGGVVVAGLAATGYFIYDRYFKKAPVAVAPSPPTPAIAPPPAQKPGIVAATTSPEINALLDAANQVAQAFPQLKPNAGGP